MQAIRTKTLPPTDTKGQRVKASCQAKSVTVAWDYAWSREQNHREAAAQLAAALGWAGDWQGGWLPDNTGCFVMIEQAPCFVVKAD